jgi:quercetin dioxygenase-like cupin family protein
MNVKRIDSITAETVQSGVGVTKKVLISHEEAPNFAMRCFEIQPGGSMPNHTNQVEHEQFVLSGSAKIGIGEEIVEVKKDDIVFIPADVPHWYRNSGNEPFIFLCLVPNKPDVTTILK